MQHRKFKVSIPIPARHSARRNKGYFNCGALKPLAITVKITRYLPRAEAEIPQCGGLHYFQALRGYGVKAWRARARARSCEQNIMSATLENHLHADAMDLFRCTAGCTRVYLLEKICATIYARALPITNRSDCRLIVNRNNGSSDEIEKTRATSR